MTGDIDEISAALGSLKAQVTEGNRQREAQFKKLDTISTQLIEVIGQVRLVADQVTTLKMEIETDIKPAVSDFKSMKAKGVGVLAFVAFMASGAGAFLQKMFANFQS